MRVAALAAGPGLVLHVDGRGGHAHDGHDRVHVARALAVLAEERDGAPRQQPVVADPVVVAHLHEELHDGIEQARERALQQRVLAAQPAREHQVGAGRARGLDERRQRRRVVLQVARHDHRVVGVDVIEAGRDGHVLAVVADELQPPHARVGGGQRLDHRPRAIAAAVVDEHELPVVGERRERGRRSADAVRPVWVRPDTPARPRLSLPRRHYTSWGLGARAGLHVTQRIAAPWHPRAMHS